MSYPALPTRLLEAIDRKPNPRALLHKEGGEWRAISSHEMLRRIAGLARALADLGVRAGDRVGLFAPNRPEWHIVDFAVLGLGAIDVPVYFREAPERLLYILNDAGAKVVVAVGEAQARCLLACRDRLPTVEHLIVAAAPTVEGEFLRYEQLIATAGDAEIADYRRAALQVRSDQVATLIYTSGTTGEPKGVMLTHANFTSNDLDSARDDDLRDDDVALTFLPLAHVYERMVDYTYLVRSVATAYVERMDDVVTALLEMRPTVMAAVPRLFEKSYATILERGQQTIGVRRKLFDWAMRVTREAIPWRGYGRPVSWRVKLSWVLANWLVYPKIRAGLGGRLRGVISGAAPLAKELLEFFWTIGVRVYQGYGLTETSPVVTTNWHVPNRIGSVGRPLRNVEVKIADDGEILVRGPCVMVGYFNKPEATREVVSEDGWFFTGDIGHLDEDGYLYITDRKKDLIKTAAGKFVAPQPIENCLKASPYIQNAVVLGDRHKFIIALVVPEVSTVTHRAADLGLQFQSPADMVLHPWVRQLIHEEIERLTPHLAQYEKIKRFALLDHDFTFETGQLTYTMKLKRRVIEQKYAAAIAELYADVEEPRPEPLD